MFERVRDELARRQSEIVDDATVGCHAVEPFGDEAARGGDVFVGRFQLDLERSSWHLRRATRQDQDMVMVRGYP